MVFIYLSIIGYEGIYLAFIILSFIILKFKKNDDILSGLSKLDILLKVSAA